MRKALGLLVAFCLTANFLIPALTAKVRAVESLAGVVISQVQADAGPGFAGHELIEIYNNSDLAVDISNWCLRYASSSSSATGNKLVCFDVASNARLFLPAHSYAVAMSEQLIDSIDPKLEHDWSFAAGLAAAGGHIRLTDSSDQEVDKLGWGTAVSAEGDSPSPAPPSGYLLQRKVSHLEGTLQDTNINNNDFEPALKRTEYIVGSIYELEIKDMCPNPEGIQEIVPEGYIIDETDNCVEDMEEIESSPSLPLVISELLPNPIGSDVGNEFIEIYNPNDQPVDLSDYYIYVAGNLTKTYPLPDLVLEPGSYRAFYNSEIKFTLVNSTSWVSIESVDGSFTLDTPVYDNPRDGDSWALIDGEWQYTNRPTPSSANLESDVQTETSEPIYSELKPCADNQFRNPETNRCKLIESASTTLTPCKEGQERNPETNRCRAVAGATSELTPCREGQERNPETNRCRNVIAMTEAEYAPEAVEESQTIPIGWWVLGGLSILGLGYGIWEWRYEIRKLFRSIPIALRRNK